MTVTVTVTVTVHWCTDVNNGDWKAGSTNAIQNTWEEVLYLPLSLSTCLISVERNQVEESRVVNYSFSWQRHSRRRSSHKCSIVYTARKYVDMLIHFPLLYALPSNAKKGRQPRTKMYGPPASGSNRCPALPLLSENSNSPNLIMLYTIR